MNLDDLRAELDARANDVDPRSTGRMAGIRAKVAQRRRRKAGAAVAASVLAVGAIIGVPVVSHLSTAPEPAKGGHFPEKLDGDTKIAEELGDEGDATVTLEFTPDDTDFLLDIDCDALAPANRSTRELREAPTVEVTVNDGILTPPCGKQYNVGVGMGHVGDLATPDRVRNYWERIGVTSGETVTVTVRAANGLMGQGGPADISGRIGIAAYEMTGGREIQDGIAFPTSKTYDGDTYELGGHDVARAGGGTATVSIPSGADAPLVTYGSPSYPGGVRRATVDGERGVLTGKGGVFSETLPDSRPHTVEVRDNGVEMSPKVVAAYYTKVADEEDADAMFPSTLDGDTKIADELGDEGDTTVKLEFTPDDTDFLLDIECDALASEYSSNRPKPSDPFLYVTVNDKSAVMPTCGAYGGGAWKGSVGDVSTTDQMRRFWEKLGVEAGDPTTIAMRVTGEGQVPDRIDGRLGVAVYDMTGDRVESEGVAFTQRKSVGGTTYELDDYDVSSSRRSPATVDVPTLEAPAMIMYGVPEMGMGVRAPVRVDGQRGVITSHGSIETAMLPDDDGHTVSINGLGIRVVAASYKRVAHEPDEDTLSIPATTGARDPLVASKVGKHGQVVLRSTFTPDDANLAVAKACALDGHDSDDVWVTMTMNDRQALSGECQSYGGEVDRGESPEANRVGWGEYDVVAGEPVDVVIRARAKNGSDVSLDGIQLGFGAYERSASRTSVNGFVLDDYRRLRGRWYKLADYRSVDVGPGQRRVGLRRSGGDAPILAAWAFDARATGWGQARVDGEHYSIRSDGAISYEPAGRDSRRLVTASGRFGDGRLLVAYYEPEE